MLSPTIEKALQEQIEREMFSCNLYLAMSAWFDDRDLEGFAHWMRVQAREEWGHAMKLWVYVNEAGGTNAVHAIPKPPSVWECPGSAFQAAYVHERHISASIGALYELANAEKDWATAEALRWFITEQVEEEASADHFVQKLAMAKDAPGGIMILDRAAAAREG